MISRAIGALALATTVFLMAEAAHATTIVGFDDLPATPNLEIADGYAALNWRNLYVFQGGLKPKSGYASGVISPRNVAYNGFGASADVSTTNGLFTFEGASFTGAFRDGMTVRIGGARNSVVEYTADVVVNTDTPVRLDVNWTGIDFLFFESLLDGAVDPTSGATTHQFAMDDFRFTMGGAAESVVPEPASWALMIAGFGLAGATLRRRRELEWGRL